MHSVLHTDGLYYTEKLFPCNFSNRIVLSSSQVHNSVELSSFCEGYFLQQMPALLERESFRSLLLGPLAARQGNASSASTLVHSRGDSPLDELEATLAQRLRSLHVTSRVWARTGSTQAEECGWSFTLSLILDQISRSCLNMFEHRWFLSYIWSNILVKKRLQHKDLFSDLAANTLLCGQFSVLYLVPSTLSPCWLRCTERLGSRKLDNVMLFPPRLGKLTRRSNKWMQQVGGRSYGAMLPSDGHNWQRTNLPWRLGSTAPSWFWLKLCKVKY